MTDDDQKLGPPPVEPMSDVTWARVERGLWSRVDSGATDALPESPRRRWLWLAVPALAVAAVIALIVGTGLFGARAEAPAVSWVEPGEPSRVVAGNAPTAVSFGDAHIDLAAQSAIVMSREGGSPSVLLERGVASFAVAPRIDRAPFVVRAGDTVVRVVGTRFTVSRSNEQITVAVERGLVDVQFRGGTQRVGAGQSWTSEAPTKVALYTPVPTTSADPVTPPVATAPVAPAAVAAPPLAAPPAPRVATPAVPTPPTAAPPVPTPRVTTPAAATPTAPVAVAKDADRAKYDQLTALERRDSKAALAGYLELSRGNTKWSAVSLFAAGRLAADLNDRRAATLLDIYLRRFPNGANADDARNLLARLKGDVP